MKLITSEFVMIDKVSFDMLVTSLPRMRGLLRILQNEKWVTWVTSSELTAYTQID